MSEEDFSKDMEATLSASTAMMFAYLDLAYALGDAKLIDLERLSKRLADSRELLAKHKSFESDLGLQMLESLSKTVNPAGKSNE